jgi:AMIN domain
MPAFIMSVVSLAGILSSRIAGWLRACVASVESAVRPVASRGESRVRTDATSIVTAVRAAASRSQDREPGWAAWVARIRRAALAHADRPIQACTASLVRLGRTVAALTEGERTPVYLAFTVTFVLATIVGTLVLSPHGARTHRTAPPFGGETPTGPEASAPGVALIPRSPSVTLPPSVALPRFTGPSKRTEADARGLDAAPVVQPQTASVVVRSTGNVRGGVAKVTDIALWGNSSKPWVSITASGPVRYHLRNVEPDWVVIDVSKAELALVSGKPPAGRGLVRLIRVGQFTPDTVRVVLELTEAVPIHVATSAGKTAIVVSLAVDAKGNSHTAPAPTRRPGAAHSIPIARSGVPAPGT